MRCRGMIAVTLPDTPYCGPPPTPMDWLGSWNNDPFLLGAFLAFGACGVLVLRGAEKTRQAGFGVAAFAATLAFISPLCALSVALFAARTVHHLVVIGVLAPALAIAFPLHRLPAMLALLALSGALWAWHIPQVYSAAWEDATVYWAMQVALILPAWAFFSALFQDRSPAPVLGLMTLVAQMGLLGALLTFAPGPFYLEHLAHAPVWGLSAVQDQQLAGLIMWIPGMIPAAVLAGFLAWRLLRQDQRA